MHVSSQSHPEIAIQLIKHQYKNKKIKPKKQKQKKKEAQTVGVDGKEMSEEEAAKRCLLPQEQHLSGSERNRVAVIGETWYMTEACMGC